MQTFEIRACTVAEIFDAENCADLFAEYERECVNSVIGSAAPDRSIYEALEGTGFAQCFAVIVESKLHGFACVLRSGVPHHGRQMATVESLFVDRATRRHGAGLTLMRMVNDHARSVGCAFIFYTAPVGSSLARLLFLCADEYPNTNHVFTKRLL